MVLKIVDTIEAGTVALGPVEELTDPVTNIPYSYQEAENENTIGPALLYILGLCLFQIIGSVCNQRTIHEGYKMGQKLRAMSMALIYQQSLRISSAEMHGSSEGEVADLLNNDSQKFYDALPEIHRMWAAPLQVVTVTAALLIIIGWTALVGVILLFLLVPFTLGLAKVLDLLRRKHVPLTDDRVTTTTEIINGIMAVKFFSWEKQFREKIIVIRDQEISMMRKEALVFSGNLTMLIWFPVMAMAATLALYGLNGNVLTAGKTFSALAYFTTVKFPILYFGVSWLRRPLNGNRNVTHGLLEENAVRWCSSYSRY